MRSAEHAARPVRNVPLAPLTTLGVGGPPEWYVRAASAPAVEAAHRWASSRGLPVFVLGGGSNVVVADGGVRGLVLHVTIGGVDERIAGDELLVDAGAGESWDGLVARTVEGGFAGMECLSGIPGAAGGTPIQNVGAYGQEVAGIIERVTVFDMRAGALVDLEAEDCRFGYRQSRFRREDAGRFVVCRVAFRLRRGAPTVTYPDVVAWMERSGLRQAGVADVRRAVLDIRRRKGMVLDAGDPDTRSVGSFFMNPVLPASRREELGAPGFPAGDGVKVPAAWLLERAGFSKGYAAGAAGLSTKHPLALVNRGGARAGEIVDLACRIKRTVLDRFGVALRPEPVFAGFGDDERVRFLLDTP